MNKAYGIKTVGPPSLSLAASNINKESKREDEKRYRKERK